MKGHGPRPTKIVSPKEKANLKRGGKNPGSGRPKKTKFDEEFSALARKWLSDPWVRRTLIQQLRGGTCPPQIVIRLMEHGWGKPVEKIETTAPAVRIVFESVEECPPNPKK